MLKPTKNSGTSVTYKTALTLGERPKTCGGKDGRLPTYRRGIYGLTSSLTLLAMTLFSTRSLVAQNTIVSPEKAQSYWSSMHKADARIQAIKVSWEQARTRLPEKSITDEKIEEAVASVAAQLALLDNGIDEAHLAESARSTRKNLRMERVGSKQTSQLLFTRVDKQTRADTVFETPQYAGSTDDPNWRSHTIDFYDWKSSVVLNEVFRVDENGSVTKNSSWMGERWQAPKHALWRSAGTFAQLFFLPGQSVTVSYDPAKTTIREGEDNTIILEMTGEDDSNQLHRTTISKETWKPLTSETILKDTGYLLLRIEAKGYKQYGDGIWFPSELNERFGKRQTTRFALKSVKFNDDVDPTGLRLPAGAHLRDERFGEVMSYKITDGSLPTDAEVRKMLGEQKEEGKAMAQAEKMGNRQLSAMMVPAAGILLMAMSCALWVRSFKKRS